MPHLLLSLHWRYLDRTNLSIDWLRSWLNCGKAVFGLTLMVTHIPKSSLLHSRASLPNGLPMGAIVANVASPLAIVRLDAASGCNVAIAVITSRPINWNNRPEADGYPSLLRAPFEKFEVGAPPMPAIAEHHFAVT